MIKQDLEIYIHIPFCKKKCAYCDFLSFPKYRENYVPALIQEIKTADLMGKKENDYIVQTVFIGGGTPSIMNAKHIRSILDAVYKRFEVAENAEITIEANPGTLTEEKLAGYREAGINRLSIGLQSADDEELRELGRIHTYEDFLKNYDAARRAGFSNINIDLMSAIPGQTRGSWVSTLQKITALNPEHISAYSLIVEEGTEFFEKMQKGLLALPTEEDERQMYYDTKNVLEGAGYNRYEISNYSKKGYECRHNTGYWRRVDYIGFGLGASSLINHKRFSNDTDLKRYLHEMEGEGENIRPHVQVLSIEEEMEEFMFLGLRLIDGISKKEFGTTFQKKYEEVYKEADAKLTAQGLLINEGDRVYLTERGLDLSNQVMAEFLIER
ncbi:radical SAM family heme chaperone HemW [Konateibacter massiliensis]|uniref:radical SAM family heme chaperone HemW n=1 Tax=Konateibacter massiliensis TaxID=2002841 RepID=UPI001F3AC048|nr:radical SAM family heme chaperone HemW [Konateibacter massiliensis]